MLGKLADRAPTHVLRLALVYALAGKSSQVLLEHLRAALAVWDYSVATTAAVFGCSTGDRLADDCLTALRDAAPREMTRTELSKYFNGHKAGHLIQSALEVLERSGLALRRKVATGGRAAERWRFADCAAEPASEPSSANFASPASPGAGAGVGPCADENPQNVASPPPDGGDGDSSFATFSYSAPPGSRRPRMPDDRPDEVRGGCPVTARQLLEALKPYNPTAVDGGGLEHEELPRHLDAPTAVLKTGLAALLAGRCWFGCEGATGHAVRLSFDALIPDSVTLLSVEGGTKWDRLHWSAKLDYPGLFSPPPALAEKPRPRRTTPTEGPLCR